METKKQIEIVIKSIIKRKHTISVKNIVLGSLFISGGTLSNEEVKSYLNDNYFKFKSGFFLFIESENEVFLNYCKKPLVIIKNYEFTYKILKNKIKSIGGFLGFKNHIKENCKKNDTWFYCNDSVLRNYKKKYPLNF